ncbi:MAG: isopenicillin N synthase family oxygenase [Alphaproteobacteria bacterium]|nr:isopenicillin N synthase family oxygenase [Alphaproteobacteria bacterium]
MVSAIPVIDVAPFTQDGAAGHRAVAEAVDRACTDLGFLIISGHGVSEALIDDMRAVSRAFFDLPVDKKMRLRMPPDRYRGYIALGHEALANSLDQASPPDLKESFSIGPFGVPDDAYHRTAKPGNFFAPNIWPDRLANFRTVWETYFHEMERVSTLLMRIFAVGLGMTENFFDDKIDHHITNFSVIHYPEQASDPLPGQLRAGAHTDYGSLTIVKPDAAPGGLQVLGKDGCWIDVPVIAGTFVVNLGDLMAEWTNDRWVSTLHRVVNPPRDKALGSRRLSTIFFHQPNYDAVIECLPTCADAAHPPRYGRTTSGEHVWMKVNKHRQPDLEKVKRAG